jgi:peptide/nickel transport system substrate-binding protein
MSPHAWLLALLLLSLATACAPTAPAAPTAPGAAPTAAVAKAPSGATSPTRGGTLYISTDGDWVTLDPVIYTNVTDRELLYSMYDTLLRFDENLDILPGLAKSWQVSADGLEYTFNLTAGVTFHDGTPFNAQAVKFNLERILDPATKSRLRSELTDIKEVQVVNDSSVKVLLSRPFSPLLGWLAEVPGFMASPTAVQKWGKDYGSHPVGTGAFQFVEQVKGDHVTVKRYDNYWQTGKPYIDQIIYRPVPDAVTQLAGLRSGALQVISNVPANQAAAVASSAEYRVLTARGSRWPMIRLNFKKAPLDNKHVRQALSMAIDRQAIVKAIYFGTAVPAYGPIAPTYAAYFDPGIEQYGFKLDTTRAKEKLAEAGLASGFTLHLDVQNTADQIQLGQLIKAQLAQIGVTVEITSFAVNTVTDHLKAGDFMASLGSWTLRPDVDGSVYRHFITGSAFNYLGYSNPQVDQLLDQTRQVPISDQRVQLYRQAQRLIVDDAPWLFLVWENQNLGSSRKVHGLELLGDAFIRPGGVWLDK